MRTTGIDAGEAEGNVPIVIEATGEFAEERTAEEGNIGLSFINLGAFTSTLDIDSNEDKKANLRQRIEVVENWDLEALSTGEVPVAKLEEQQARMLEILRVGLRLLG